jgi:hypothetical protein
MRFKNKTIIIAVAMLILAASLLPQVYATTTAQSNTTFTTLNGATVCPKNTNIKLADIDKVFVDPRVSPKNGGYTGTNIGSVQTIGLITKTMSRTSFPSNPTTATVTIRIAAVPAGTFALVDDFLPAGFSFANPKPSGFTIDGVPGTTSNVIILFDGQVRFRLGPGAHTITFKVVSPRWGVSFVSQDFARVFYINAFGVVFAFDQTAVTVFVQGTGSFIMSNAMVTKPNYRPQMPKATCTT